MQEHIWEREYRNPRLVSGSIEPQASVKDFLRWVRKSEVASDKNSVRPGLPLENLNVLDLGCGNGKNSIYIARLDGTNEVTGIDISETALTEARELAYEAEVDEQTEFMKQSIGAVLPFPSESFDLILDATSSNSLSDAERAIYLTETHRVLKSSTADKPSGFLFVRALCKDGDTNAQTLLKMNPGKEYDTYIMPDIGLTERVFSKEDFIATYSALFNILHLEKETHYTKIETKTGTRSYKRNFWVAYIQKKE